MFAKINQWEEEVNSITQDFANSFSSLSEAQLNYKPNTDTWSITENIQHIIAVNNSYFPILELLHRGEYQVSFLGQIKWLTIWLGNLIYNSVLRDRSRKIKTFPIWQPDQSKTGFHPILEHFKQHHQKLIAAIKRSSPLLEASTVISSPANKNIVYTLEKAFDIILEHERRHFNQALDIKVVISKK